LWFRRLRKLRCVGQAHAAPPGLESWDKPSFAPGSVATRAASIIDRKMASGILRRSGMMCSSDGPALALRQQQSWFTRRRRRDQELPQFLHIRGPNPQNLALTVVAFFPN
jgi:hypothetical protein